jgi:hypothetical protein
MNQSKKKSFSLAQKVQYQKPMWMYYQTKSIQILHLY